MVRLQRPLDSTECTPPRQVPFAARRPELTADCQLAHGPRGLAAARELLPLLGERRSLQKGDALFRPDDRAQHLFVVERGALDIFLLGDSGGCAVASFGAGASFIYDFSKVQLARCEAAEVSVVADIPVARMAGLAREGVDLQLVTSRYSPFDLQDFLAACYPE